MNRVLTTTCLGLLLLIGALSGCATRDGSVRLLSSAENHKYRLRAQFQGEEVRLPHRDFEVIHGVLIDDSRSNITVRYQPKDETSVVEAMLYFTNVWSPDEEFVALP